MPATPVFQSQADLHLRRARVALACFVLILLVCVVAIPWFSSDLSLSRPALKIANKHLEEALDEFRGTPIDGARLDLENFTRGLSDPDAPNMMIPALPCSSNDFSALTAELDDPELPKNQQDFMEEVAKRIAEDLKKTNFTKAERSLAKTKAELDYQAHRLRVCRKNIDKLSKQENTGLQAATGSSDLAVFFGDERSRIESATSFLETQSKYLKELLDQKVALSEAMAKAIVLEREVRDLSEALKEFGNAIHDAQENSFTIDSLFSVLIRLSLAAVLLFGAQVSLQMYRYNIRSHSHFRSIQIAGEILGGLGAPLQEVVEVARRISAEQIPMGRQPASPTEDVVRILAEVREMRK